ncbi:hypothetical protein G6F70_007753 [Rhizopus microsporus]|uniref:S-adenosyl-L-methionine-dependent methyltransferase n=3 Tax=Rhizopus TaxID=4842 RepID=A0A1X0RN57_RHIZD|nr:hypothetical protein G6F71_007687 [Rhizopus microsporus]KAG1196042.1 hypothetical protein G6F70_007753 [Rhizopus microsporus]KAG1208641.1 hypothetical protein G6F69_007046 [Rhizopus microsporus]KAG1228961.1 hypothetical protein G6F67_007486 [Rhizopus microsporus]KAG1263593.1 hypothetical protein G6F68_005025 [Rhizopus microsporus]
MGQDNWSSNKYVKHAAFVPRLGSVILDVLDPQPHEHILDFGCGNGILTRELAGRCKSVVGIDASKAMIDGAPSVKNVEYFVVDGHDADKWFDETGQSPFDAVFSSATLHWLKRDPVKAIKSIHHTLKPGGRLVAELGGFMNCASVHTALIAALNVRGIDGAAYSPWFFPSPEYYSQLLTDNGFKVLNAELIPRPTELETDVAGWIETFGFNFLNALDSDSERKKMVAEIQEYLRPAHQREDGKWFLLYTRLRVVAVKQV